MNKGEAEELPASIGDAYSVQTFETRFQQLQTRLRDHLANVTDRTENVLNWDTPGEMVSLAETFLRDGDQLPSTERSGRFEELLDAILAHGQNLHHPRYIGHQVPASVPIASLFDALASVTNQPMAIYEMGPWATAVEHAVVRELLRRVGWNPDHSSGLLTNGGSLANLTALLTARNVAFPDSWEKGTPRDAVLFAHPDAHYCVTRSAGILGLGTAQIRKPPLDSNRRIDPKQLHIAIEKELAAGRRVLAVAAASCATPIGAFDPLNEIADVCTEHGIWLHVDAAHGGSALMSRKHRHLLSGIDRADSVVWDAHKMMFVPALCAAVLYRNKDHRYSAFQQEAPYLFDPADPGMAAYDSGMGTVECTKRALGFPLWGIWSMYGAQIFEQLVDRSFSLTNSFHQMLVKAEDFEPLYKPECNIVVFRYLPESIRDAALDVQNMFQQETRTKLIRSGHFYIVQTKIDGVAALRCTMMNPLTTEVDLTDLIQALREI